MIERGVASILLEGYELNYREMTVLVKDFVKTTGLGVTQFAGRARECDVPALEYIGRLCKTHALPDNRCR